MSRAVAGTLASLVASAGLLAVGLDRAMDRRDATPRIPHDDADDVRRRHVVSRTPCRAIPHHDAVVYEQAVRPRLPHESAEAQLAVASEIAAADGTFSGIGRALLRRFRRRNAKVAEHADDELPVERYRYIVLEPTRAQRAAAQAGMEGDHEDLVAAAISLATNTMLSGSTDQTQIKCATTPNDEAVARGVAAPCVADPAYLCPMYLRTMLLSIATVATAAPSSSSSSSLRASGRDAADEQRPAARVAVLGGGGAALPLYVANALPAGAVDLDVVDIEPAMFEATEKGLGVAPTPHMRFVAADAAAFAGDAERRGRYDAVLVDCYVGNTVPEALKSAAFLANLKKLLRGSRACECVAFNLPGADPDFEARCKKAFAGDVKVARVPHASNVVYTCSLLPGAGFEETVAHRNPFSFSLRRHCP